MQEWVHWIYGDCPAVGLSAEAHGAETLLRKLLEGSIDLAFLFDAPQLPELMVAETIPVALILVSTRPGLDAPQALMEDYVMVDWGTSFGIAHARQFPDMPAPRARVGLGRIAKAMILACGGSAYLAEAMVSEELNDGSLFVTHGCSSDRGLDKHPWGGTVLHVSPDFARTEVFASGFRACPI